MRASDAPYNRAFGALAQLPSQVLAIMDALEDAGHEAWLVGGFVRDALRGVTPHDADLATDALWQEVSAAARARGFDVIETGTKHGTVTVVVDGCACEVTTFRTEDGYADHRHPDAVHFVSTIEEDLARRDFTVNAMAFHPHRGLVDPFDGQHDLAHRIIRCVRDPRERFEEDALRIVRALRFASQLGFWIDPDTEIALRENAGLLADVAGERLDDELTRLLCGAAVRATLMRYPDVLGVVIPCLLPMVGFDQYSRWHVFDVLEHTAHVVEATPSYPLVRWAALFHDSGKPDTFLMDADGVGHMPGHQIVSVEHMRKTAQRLHFSRKFTHELTLLVRFHDDHPGASEKDVRKLYAKLEGDAHLFHVMCDLMRADAMGQAEFSHARVKTIDEVEALFNAMVARDACLTVHDLPVSGDDLKALGVPQGPYIGLLLGELFNAVANETVAPERPALLAYAKRLIEND